MQISAEQDIKPSIITLRTDEELGGVFLIKCPNHSDKEAWDSEAKQTSFSLYVLMCGLILLTTHRSTFLKIINHRKIYIT